MTEDLLAQIELLRREVDEMHLIATDLQARVIEKPKRWYTNPATIVSILAFSLSLVTTYFADRRVAAQDVRNAREELRVLLQRLSALPRENLEATKKYEGDPSTVNSLSSLFNQENTMLARQAAELSKRLPTDMVSATEYYSIAVALQSAYDLRGAAESLQTAVKKAQDFNTEIGARRLLASVEFLAGNQKGGREEYENARKIFAKYKDYDPYTVAQTTVLTELAWAGSEATTGNPSLIAQHLDAADGIAGSLPVSPGARQLRGLVTQARNNMAGVLPNTPSAITPILGVGQTK